MITITPKDQPDSQKSTHSRKCPTRNPSLRHLPQTANQANWADHKNQAHRHLKRRLKMIRPLKLQVNKLRPSLDPKPIMMRTQRNSLKIEFWSPYQTTVGTLIWKSWRCQSSTRSSTTIPTLDSKTSWDWMRLRDYWRRQCWCQWSILISFRVFWSLGRAFCCLDHLVRVRPCWPKQWLQSVAPHSSI